MEKGSFKIEKKFHPERLFIRKDYVDTINNGYQHEKNDFNNYILYLRIEDSVLRIHHINQSKREIMYDYLTSPDYQPRQDVFINKMNEVIDCLCCDKEEKFYRIIRREEYDD